MAKRIPTNYNVNNTEAIAKWMKVFERAGFGGYAIDFSFADPKVIEAMGEAVLKVIEEIGEEPEKK